MRHRAFSLPLTAALAASSALAWTTLGALADTSPLPVDDDTIQASTVTFGGADPLTTDRTIQHWSGETTNPLDGITYRYNMVGVDPATDGAATIGVDIIPLDVTVDGVAFNGSERVAGLLASPLFNTTNFSFTRAITKPDGTKWYRPAPSSPFPLSDGNSGQLLDAQMRAQFNKVHPDSSYHLLLDTPVVYDPETIDVSQEHGATMVSPVGVLAAAVDLTWFQTRVQNLIEKLHLDPTRLAVFVSKDVMLYKDHDPTHCCVMGGHGAGSPTSRGSGPVSGNGNQPVQTFLWSAWISPGFWGPRAWINKDISGFTHEFTEWANDPFNNNTVQPWKADNARQYGCMDLLETADPLVGVGFSTGQNTFDPANLPNGAPNPFVEGKFHIQDEAFLPWFMHIGPVNDMTQPSQFTPNGRYTFMGDFSPFEWFQRPADTC